MSRRPLILVLALLALLAVGHPASASAATVTGTVIAREHRVSGGQLDVRVLLGSANRRRLNTSVPVVVVRIRPSQLRSLTGTFRSPAKFLRLGDVVQLRGARRSGSRIRVRQVRERANASLPTFSEIDRQDLAEVRALLEGQQRTQGARTRGEPAAAIKELIKLGALYNGVASTNERRAQAQQAQIDRARAQLPTGARRAAAASALDRALARPASEVALRRSVARRLRDQVEPLDEEILVIGGRGTAQGSPFEPVTTVNGILGALDGILPGVGALLNDLAGTGAQVGELAP